MLTQPEVLEILEELAEELPEEFFDELNGGVVLQEEAKPHPQGSGDLWIMGEYCKGGYLGRYINIYYGSFSILYGNLSREELKKELRHTLRHEFRHHLESRAGEKDLEVIDAIRLAEYKRKTDDQQ